MFRSKKPKTEYITFYKDWAHADAEIERLGQRLDAVRGTIKQLEAAKVPENHWALRHWREAEAVILRKWKHTIRLKDTGLRQSGVVREGPEVDYSWWEDHDGIGGSVFPIFNFMNDWFNQSDLSASWERAMRNRLEMARKGLA